MITVEASALARAMKNAAAIVEPSNTIMIAANVRLVVNDGALEITTTNLDLQYDQVVCQADGKLETTVDAKRLAALASAAGPGAQMTLDDDGSRLTVKAGRSRWQLPTMPARDFPIMPFAGGTSKLILGGRELARAIGRVAWAASTESTRYYLNGIFMHLHEGRLRLVATDGGALAAGYLGAVAEAQPAIIATKLVGALSRALADSEHSAELEWDDRKMRVAIGDVTLTGKLVDGTFPDYTRVIPPADNPVHFSREAMVRAIRNVQAVGVERTRAVSFVCGDGQIEVGHAANTGSGHDVVLADCKTGLSTGFNPALLLPALDALGEEVAMSHADAAAPALLTNPSDGDFLAVVMPMRI